MSEPIRFDGVNKSYGDVVALEDVDLELQPGEVHCLVGPNGSGKTTLLDLLLGLTRPTSGTVTVPDVPIGCSFQSPTFYPGLTVTENLDVFARLSGCPDDAWRERLLDVFGLDRVAGQLAGTLSGGWQKKLDLALGFLKRPTYLLLDEPFSELDDASKRRLLDFLADFCTEDRTVLVVTHHVGRFEAIVDRLTVFDGGQVRYDGAVGHDENAHDRYLDVLGLE
ncbi:ABC transporter ATP-binding protein [Haloarcula salinisoli]|uniref:ABC transporter ATP-binding protein n=1 Tax=Haloarcula salinisoli TaxID=2487746 RepID=A0A8J7YG76_9EURY|nr:ABC transporter ATP-binding protein [Halomicroarcula salinisoli]MBX0305345.1 ABC transporter ATP-binding protein [Halomicroarcula salinisoli]